MLLHRRELLLRLRRFRLLQLTLTGLLALNLGPALFCFIVQGVREVLITFLKILFFCDDTHLDFLAHLLIPLVQLRKHRLYSIY